MGIDKGQDPIGQAFETDDEIVIIGNPPDLGNDVPDDDPRQHNCDAMGCGMCHVLYRFPKPRQRDSNNAINEPVCSDWRKWRS